MAEVILLDTTPLGLAASPVVSDLTQQINLWLNRLVDRGVVVLVPEIADYEVRRELMLQQKQKSLARLTQLRTLLGYVPLTTETLELAADYWAQVRKQGRPTADLKALDGDVILAAQATLLQRAGHGVTIATSNVKHFEMLVTAQLWQEIG